MLFMDRPAERPEELFDRREEVEQLRRAAAARQLALVVGMRRIGKTSVVKAGTYGRPRIYIDARSFEERPYISYADLLEALRRELRRLLPMHKRLGELLAKVRGVSVAGVEVRFEAGRSAPGLSELLQVLDEWAGDRGERLLLIIDEAQELAKLKGRQILPALGYAYDNLKNLSMVLTGSKAGLLLRFLGLEDPESPLYGRYAERIELRPFTREQALEYLEEGFRQAGASVDAGLLEAAVEALGGVVGWLAYFGLNALWDPATALEATVRRATEIAAEEFCNFVRYMGSRRYIPVAKLAAARGARWSDVKRLLQAEEGRPIGDSEVTKLLRKLVDYGFLEKRGEVYAVPDPILRRALQDVQCQT